MKVCIGKNYSEPKALTYSVPQGSIGGPVLFNCYCSTLKYAIPKNLDLKGFADDHTLLGSFVVNNNNSKTEILTSIEKARDSISDWMNQTRLKLNPTKNEIVKFGSRQMLQKSDDFTIRVLSDPLNLSLKYAEIL